MRSIEHGWLPHVHLEAAQHRLSMQVKAHVASALRWHPNPAEFLQLYELSIKAANSDEKVTANWFPMALKDGARSWLLNLPAGSISSWGEMPERFIANFQGARHCPSAAGDLRCIKQQPGETL